MKKTGLIIALMMCLVNFLTFSQDDDVYYEDTLPRTIKSSDLSLGSPRPGGKFDKYINKNGTEYKVGDTITINKPSGVNGKFVYIQSVDIMGQSYVVGSEATNTLTIIKNIRVGGTKRSGWKVVLQTKGFTFVDNYFIYIEDCIDSGEVKSSVMTSDEALTELKRWKDKLDLGLINQEEFEKNKIRLSKFIK